jgi:hypothetical protein
MNNARLRLALAGETHGSPAGPLLGRKALGFPTPLPAHGPRIGP